MVYLPLPAGIQPKSGRIGVVKKKRAGVSRPFLLELFNFAKKWQKKGVDNPVSLCYTI